MSESKKSQELKRDAGSPKEPQLGPPSLPTTPGQLPDVPTDGTQVDIDSLSVRLLLIVSQAAQFQSVATFLTRRGWPTQVTQSLNGAIKHITKDRPDFVLVSVNHPSPKAAVLPALLTQTFQVTTVAITEKTDHRSMGRLNAAKTPHKIGGPVSGPTIQRKLKLILSEMYNGSGHEDGVGGPSNRDEKDRDFTIVQKRGTADDNEVLRFSNDNKQNGFLKTAVINGESDSDSMSQNFYSKQNVNAARLRELQQFLADGSDDSVPLERANALEASLSDEDNGGGNAILKNRAQAEDTTAFESMEKDPLGPGWPSLRSHPDRTPAVHGSSGDAKSYEAGSGSQNSSPGFGAVAGGNSGMDLGRASESAGSGSDRGLDPALMPEVSTADGAAQDSELPQDLFDELFPQTLKNEITATDSLVEEALIDCTRAALVKCAQNLTADFSENWRQYKSITAFSVESQDFTGQVIIAHPDVRLEENLTATFFEKALRAELAARQLVVELQPGVTSNTDEFSLVQVLDSTIPAVITCPTRNGEWLGALVEDKITLIDRSKGPIADTVTLKWEVIDPDTPLTFNAYIYLPENDKLILYIKAENRMSERQKQKMLAVGTPLFVMASEESHLTSYALRKIWRTLVQQAALKSA